MLWLVGAALRVTVLTVPPVLPLLHAGLHLSETDVGILSSLPLALFAGAAVPGSLLIARYGARATIFVGLLLSAVASALRGAVPSLLWLDLATILMAAGVAIMQPSLPPLVRQWTPRSIGFSTALYTNGLLVGEILVVSLTIPLLPLLGGSWRLDFLFWSLPVLITALLLPFLPPRAKTPPPHSALGARRRWWPDWRKPLIWRLGLMMASANSVYFGTNAFLPDYMTAVGQPDLIGAALSAVNLTQLPASFLMLAFTDRLALRAWPYVVAGITTVISVAGIVLMPGPAIVVWAGVIGFANAVVLILTLTLPALTSAPGDEHRTSAGMFTISYSCAVTVPILGGAFWDATDLPPLALAPVALSGLAVALLAASADLARHRH
jgi:MFS transporter, CP family, cyanate transporter